ESGAIRLIVWQGALDIFKHYPILGSGVETFAYSYYTFRPASHNLVSEWDFLYNKAHNEYLNYLANTGIVGFICYLAIILTFLIWNLKYFFSKPKNADINLLVLAIFASYISYLIQNFFGFSVVSVALFFYLFPALTFILTNSIKTLKIPPMIHNTFPISQLLYRRPLYTNLAKTFIIIIFGLIIITLFRNYWADTYFAVGNNASDAGNPGKAYNQLTNAVSLNPGEPYYRSELAFAAASAAVALSEDDPTTSARLKNEAIKETEKVLKESPKNVSFYRSAIRTYYLLSTLDPNFTDKTLQVMDQTIALAPTDAKLIYNKAIILGQLGKNQEAIKALEKAIALKPNYSDAIKKLKEWNK
ncbi:MAG: O-antigen ligase family protein, partial [Candidatus Daviesbacteria bacterium]|nr:O-antigen ligase family protein [Candidatus Daviesbacteria bacterium]